jgi:hypothetical protein
MCPSLSGRGNLSKAINRDLEAKGLMPDGHFMPASDNFVTYPRRVDAIVVSDKVTRYEVDNYGNKLVYYGSPINDTYVIISPGIGSYRFNYSLFALNGNLGEEETISDIGYSCDEKIISDSGLHEDGKYSRLQDVIFDNKYDSIYVKINQNEVHFVNFDKDHPTSAF